MTDLFAAAGESILKEAVRVFEFLTITTIWIVGIFFLSWLGIKCIRCIAKSAGADNLSFIDLIKKSVGDTKNGKPFILSMLGLNIVAISLRGKIMFLAILSTVIGSTSFTLAGGILEGFSISNPLDNSSNSAPVSIVPNADQGS